MGEISRDFFFSLDRPLDLRNRERALEAWVFTLALGGASLILLLVLLGYRLEHPPVVVLLAGLALAAEDRNIRLTPTLEVTVASLVTVFAAVVLGPLSGALVAVVGQLRNLPRRDTERPTLRWATWTSIDVVSITAAGVAAAAVRADGRHDFVAIFLAVAAAFVAEELVGLALRWVAPAIRGTGTFLRSLRAWMAFELLGLPLHVPTVALLGYVYWISPWSVALFAVPALAAQRLLVLYREQRETSEALTTANERLESANLSFATALVATLDARDRYTAGHSTAVAVYARDIAVRMGLSEREQDLVHLCGLVHDIGKIGLSAGLLEKAGPLTLEERREMERHPVIGEEILRNVDDYDEIAVIVRHHHERVDGTGYPDRLASDDIPLLARIIAVADSYNAMTSDRPYRDAMPSRVARLRVAQAVESQFDTAVVAAFEAILTSATESYRLGRSDQFDLRVATREHPELAPLPLDVLMPAAAIA
ncbi:MAG TPA: HD-GYP domain-containing protein [Gaiellaceae bacterium]|nr:HD-GYP domain-containing protein [Gaiellaceae bacterium]